MNKFPLLVVLLAGVFIFVILFGLSNLVSIPSVTAKDVIQTPSPSVEVVPTETPTKTPEAPNVEEKPPPQKEEACGLKKNDIPNKVYRWCTFVERYAKIYNVDPYLVFAIITQESGGDPKAGQTIQIIEGIKYHTSASGAVGLMQVMPCDGISGTIPCLNGLCFADRPTAAKLVDPETNIRYGTRMLANLIRENGSILEGVKAYGPRDNPGYYASMVMGYYNTYSSPKKK